MCLSALITLLLWKEIETHSIEKLKNKTSHKTKISRVFTFFGGEKWIPKPTGIDKRPWKDGFFFSLFPCFPCFPCLCSAYMPLPRKDITTKAEDTWDVWMTPEECTIKAEDIKAGFKTTTKISAKLRPFGALFFLPSNPTITRMISIYRPILCC